MTNRTTKVQTKPQILQGRSTVSQRSDTYFVRSLHVWTYKGNQRESIPGIEDTATLSPLPRHSGTALLEHHYLKDTK